jgi:hypothetical protein
MCFLTYLIELVLRKACAWATPFWARSQNCEKRLLASSCLSVYLTVRPHGTSPLPPDACSRNLIFVYFSKICRENSVSLTLILLTWRLRWGPNNASRWQIGFHKVFKVLKPDKNTAYFHDDRYKCLITLRSVLLIMRNISEKNCRETQNTHFILNFF